VKSIAQAESFSSAVNTLVEAFSQLPLATKAAIAVVEGQLETAVGEERLALESELRALQDLKADTDRLTVRKTKEGMSATIDLQEVAEFLPSLKFGVNLTTQVLAIQPKLIFSLKAEYFEAFKQQVVELLASLSAGSEETRKGFTEVLQGYAEMLKDLVKAAD
jgi:hypothetical protein